MSAPQPRETVQPSCQLCRRQPGADGIILHNVSPTGVPWMWRCDAHLLPEHRLLLKERGLLSVPKEDL